ncbi:MAG: MFS transporter [Gemmataceae bacterium]
MEPTPIAARLRRWQLLTTSILFIGYAGYYVTRSNLSVASPLLLEDFGPALQRGHIGDIASFGVLCYAFGKFFNGIATEYLGGRGMFLGGMVASLFCTVCFWFAGTMLLMPGASVAAVTGAAPVALVGMPLTALGTLFVIWGLNRFVQSMGWVGLVQLAGRWYEPHRLATMMGILSLSYLLGDALARLILGALAELGLGWGGLFLSSAAILGAISLFVAVFLKTRPAQLGLPEPAPPPENVYGSDAATTPLPLRQLLRPLLTSRVFWLVCAMNVGLTLLRETFNFWNPTYLNEVVKLSPGVAGMTSLIFPLAGAFSSLLGGWLVDRSAGRYSAIIIPCMIGLCIVLAAIALLPISTMSLTFRAPVALGLLALAALFLIAPYTFCSGVLALRLGGQRGGAASAGIIDTAGYLGATLAGSGIGRIADAFGWSAVFGTLAVVALLTAIVAGFYALAQRGRSAS